MVVGVVVVEGEGAGELLASLLGTAAVERVVWTEVVGAGACWVVVVGGAWVVAGAAAGVVEGEDEPLPLPFSGQRMRVTVTEGSTGACMP